MMQDQDAIDATDEATQFSNWLYANGGVRLHGREQAELASRFHGHRASSLAALREENGRLRRSLRALCNYIDNSGDLLAAFVIKDSQEMKDATTALAQQSLAHDASKE